MSVWVEMKSTLLVGMFSGLGSVKHTMDDPEKT